MLNLKNIIEGVEKYAEANHMYLTTPQIEKRIVDWYALGGIEDESLLTAAAIYDDYNTSITIDELKEFQHYYVECDNDPTLNLSVHELNEALYDAYWNDCEDSGGDE